MTPRMRAVVLSAGAWSMFSHIPTLISDQGVDLVGVSSPSETTRAQLSTRWPGLRVTDDWRILLDGPLDLVIVSSPPIAHREMVVVALGHAPIVLVEKPFATTHSDADAMVTAAESSGSTLLVGFSWGSCELFRTAVPYIPRLGRIEYVDAKLSVNTRELLTGHPVGGWGDEARPNVDTYTDRTLSGGGAGSVSTPHLVAVLDWLIGFEPISALGLAAPADRAIDLHLAALLQEPNGRVTNLSTTSSQVQSRPVDWDISCYGEQADLHLSTRTASLELVPHDQSTPPTHVVVSGDVDRDSPTKAAIAVARGFAAPPIMHAHVGLRTVATMEAVYRAVESGASEPVINSRADTRSNPEVV